MLAAAARRLDFPHGARSTRSITIACWVLRVDNHTDEHLTSLIRTGWGQTCDILEFIDKGTPGVVADWEETYHDLAAKSYRAWQFMYRKFIESRNSGAPLIDFVMKVDMDTYILEQNLRAYLRNFEPNMPHYLGRQFVLETGTTFNAGVAIILSREALRIFALSTFREYGMCSRDKFKAQGSAEDVALAMCLREDGIYPHNNRDVFGAERFMVFNPETMRQDAPFPDWYERYSFNLQKAPGCCSAEAISFHYVKPHQMHHRLSLVGGVWS